MPWLHEKLQLQQEPSIPDDSQNYAGDTKQCPIGPFPVGTVRGNLRFWRSAYTCLLHHDCDHNARQQKPDPDPDLRTGGISMSTAPRGQSIAESVPKACSFKEWRTPER